MIDPFVLHGRADLYASLERGDWHQSWADWPTWEPQEFLEVDGKLLAFVRYEARGRTSGVGVVVVAANLWTFREGVPVEIRYLGSDRAAAIEAAAE